jgi:hypothetical protein
MTAQKYNVFRDVGRGTPGYLAKIYLHINILDGDAGCHGTTYSAPHINGNRTPLRDKKQTG